MSDRPGRSGLNVKQLSLWIQFFFAARTQQSPSALYANPTMGRSRFSYRLTPAIDYGKAHRTSLEVSNHHSNSATGLLFIRYRAVTMRSRTRKAELMTNAGKTAVS